jgi:hypothetical protein
VKRCQLAVFVESPGNTHNPIAMIFCGDLQQNHIFAGMPEMHLLENK